MACGRHSYTPPAPPGAMMPGGIIGIGGPGCMNGAALSSSCVVPPSPGRVIPPYAAATSVLTPPVGLSHPAVCSCGMTLGRPKQRHRIAGHIGVKPKPMYAAAACGASRGAPAVEPLGEVHMLVVSLDYTHMINRSAPASQMTCTIDGTHVIELAKQCGVADITKLFEHEATTSNVHNAIRLVGHRCKPNDYFILFYSGHGTSVTDMDGDEVDGHDEAYVLCDSQTRQAIPPLGDSLMTDDELVQLLSQSVNAHVKVIVISDCCHSGSICDFKKQVWKGRAAVSVNGCRDTQTSGDTGSGGICTHALLLAIEQMQKKGLTSYNLSALFRETILIDDSVFHNPQDITLDSAPGFRPSEMQWPLVPKTAYAAPYTGHHPGLPEHQNHTVAASYLYPHQLLAGPEQLIHPGPPSYVLPAVLAGASSYVAPPTVNHFPMVTPVAGANSVFNGTHSLSPHACPMQGSQCMSPHLPPVVTHHTFG